MFLTEEDVANAIVGSENTITNVKHRLTIRFINISFF